LPVPMVSSPGYGCRGSGESGSEMCALCRECCPKHVEVQLIANKLLLLHLVGLAFIYLHYEMFNSRI